MRVGILPRWGSFWVGAHWSPYYKRLCVNVIPCVTVWFTFDGGMTPAEAKAASSELVRQAAEYKRLRKLVAHIRMETYVL